MDSTKNRSIETYPGDDNDRPEKVNDDQTVGIGRSYDCTFCKRGFTNAQALGGHMNIHRKEKAKVKVKGKKHRDDDNSLISNKVDEIENYATCTYFAPMVREERQSYKDLGAQMDYRIYFPRSNPSLPHVYHLRNFSAGSEISGIRGEDLGVNLSLCIGPPLVEDNESKKGQGKGPRSGNEVDLELRLGHSP
ncbi:unnamed protein product [Thlaspi arvense]|uniref:C2H2-type domain-containing protein n=1 Tax=Thlaspi arvense TaxID=13288 RepID=A0AAU9SML9_THLAR|nr:unnamed protein product [Thlaspi arvense]